MIDYELLRVIWWVLVGVLLIGFAITDGFDLGVGALLTLAGRTDEERRVMINTIGPHWDGNQVWFITAGGAIFAAWPMIYATAFSAMYLALFLTLAALWMRPIGFDYRSKLPSRRWRTSWDWALFAGGLVPALIFGVAFGNLLLGIPFRFDENLKSTFDGNLFTLLSPFAILAGLVSVAMILTHGATWLQMKTAGPLKARAEHLAALLALVTLALFLFAGLMLALFVDGYVVTSVIDPSATSNPLRKTVSIAAGAWLDNYGKHPWMLLAPLLAVGGGLLCVRSSRAARSGWAFVGSSLMVTGIISTAGCSLFPFLLPSSVMPNASLTIWDATSSHQTLQIMFVVACVFVPLVLAYTAFGFYKMRGRLHTDQLDQGHTIY